MKRSIILILIFILTCNQRTLFINPSVNKGKNFRKYIEKNNNNFIKWDILYLLIFEFFQYLMKYESTDAHKIITALRKKSSVHALDIYIYIFYNRRIEGIEVVKKVLEGIAEHKRRHIRGI